MSDKQTTKPQGKRRKPPKRLIDISAPKARDFLLEGKQYCSFDLPEYFTLDALLQAVRDLVGEVAVDTCLKLDADYSAVSHTLVSNKDGAYAMRPLTLTHPVLYYLLVRELTEAKAWSQIRRAIRRQEKAVETHILVASTPLIPEADEAFKASTTILNWWHKMEQLSIELSLDYTYMLSTDISNCYGALDSRLLSRILPKGLGDSLQSLVQMLQGGVAIGIPQGSLTYDLLAELMLGELDRILVERLRGLGINEGYYIIRYRDDYRIFGHDKMLIHKIFVTLQTLLLEVNCHLGPSKTNITTDLVLSSIKRDKLYYLENTPVFNKKGCDFDSVQKHLMYILLFARKYPNGGQLCAMLDDLIKRIRTDKIYWDKSSVATLAAILMELVHSNPRVCTQGIELLRLFTEHLETQERKALFARIKRRLLSSSLNNVLAQIWLQYLTISTDLEGDSGYDATLCLLAEGQDLQLWSRKCLRGKYAQYAYERSLCNAEYAQQTAPKPIHTRPDYEASSYTELSIPEEE